MKNGLAKDLLWLYIGSALMAFFLAMVGLGVWTTAKWFLRSLDQHNNMASVIDSAEEDDDTILECVKDFLTDWTPCPAAGSGFDGFTNIDGRVWRPSWYKNASLIAQEPSPSGKIWKQTWQEHDENGKPGRIHLLRFGPSCHSPEDGVPMDDCWPPDAGGGGSAF